jgi:hypothetical protein
VVLVNGGQTLQLRPLHSAEHAHVQLLPASPLTFRACALQLAATVQLRKQNGYRT